MKDAASARGRAVFDEINITPLTDIFLVLLIIMMVVAPMMNQLNAEIQPPTVESGAAVDQTQLTVEVTADGQYALNGAMITVDSLAMELQAIMEERGVADEEEKTLIVRADKNARSSAVIRVIEAARDARFHKVTVAGQKSGSVSALGPDELMNE